MGCTDITASSLRVRVPVLSEQRISIRLLHRPLRDSSANHPATRERASTDGRRERKHRGQRHRNRRQDGDQQQRHDLAKWHRDGNRIDTPSRIVTTPPLNRTRLRTDSQHRLLLRTFALGLEHEFRRPAEFRAFARRHHFGHRFTAAHQCSGKGLRPRTRIDRVRPPSVSIDWSRRPSLRSGEHPPRLPCRATA